MKTRTKRASRSIFFRKEDESGASAVEFALILPLLLTFLIGVIVYGYILSMQQSVTEAAAEGARAAAIALPEKPEADRIIKAKSAIDNTMEGYDTQCGADGLTCTVTIAPCVGDALQRCATVIVSYDWEANPKTPTLPLLPAPDKIEHTSVVEVS